MKKSTLALAVAAILASPLTAQADTILYGSARVSVDYTDDDSTDGYWDVVNNDSRLGVQGSEDLGGGLSAVYQYEFGVDLTEGTSGFENNRPKFVGLKGNFGTITLGTQETPYYGIVGVTDLFNSSQTFGPSAWLGGSFSGYDWSTSTSGRDPSGAVIRLNNSILYTSPEFNGLSASVMLSINGAAGNNKAGGLSDDIDVWNISVKYNNGPLFAGVSYIALNGSDTRFSDVDLDLDQWAIGLGYNSGPFSISFTYEQGTYNEWGFLKPSWKSEGYNTDTPWNAYLAGSYTFGNSVIGAAYGRLDTGLSGVDGIDNYVVGYQYNFSKRTRLWVEYIGRSADQNVPFYGDLNIVSIGTRVDF